VSRDRSNWIVGVCTVLAACLIAFVTAYA